MTFAFNPIARSWVPVGSISHAPISTKKGGNGTTIQHWGNLEHANDYVKHAANTLNTLLGDGDKFNDYNTLTPNLANANAAKELHRGLPPGHNDPYKPVSSWAISKRCCQLQYEFILAALKRQLGRNPLARQLGQKRLVRQLGRKRLVRQLGRKRLVRQLGRKRMTRQLGRKRMTRQLGCKRMTLSRKMPWLVNNKGKRR
jgi:hypothetical protein